VEYGNDTKKQRMKTDLTEIRKALIDSFDDFIPPLRVKVTTEENYEFSGTKEVMQGKKKVDGIYFASIVPKPKDIRLYFFPIYTHVDQFQNLSPGLKKCKKGKSCFHIKKLSAEMEVEIEEMVAKGVALYKEDEWI
jgi:hypothetical protein